MTQALSLVATNLTVRLPHKDTSVVVVDACDVTLQPGEIVGLVGESGSGKTMLGATMMGLLPRGAAVSADRFTLGTQDLRACDERAWRVLRGTQIAMVFQDPMTSLNPYRRIGSQLAEMLPHVPRKARKQAIIEALTAVKLPAPERCANAWPHELSGGMRQRVLIAMMLLGEPSILIADEPTTALDVTVQAAVLRLLQELVRRRNMAMLLISHDLAVVASVSDRVLVMKSGQIVESGPAKTLLTAPQHEYTRHLLASRPGALR